MGEIVHLVVGGIFCRTDHFEGASVRTNDEKCGAAELSGNDACEKFDPIQ